MKKAILVLLIAILAVISAGCISTDAPNGVEYQKTVITNPGEHVVIWKSETNKDVIYQAFLSEDYFRIFDDESVQNAAKANEAVLKAELVSYSSAGYTYYGVVIEEIGDGQIIVSSTDPDNGGTPKSYTIGKDVYLDLYKENEFFEYPATFEPVEEVKAPESSESDFADMVGAYKDPAGEMSVWIYDDGYMMALIEGSVYEGTLEYIGANSAKQTNGETTIFFTVVDGVLVITINPDNIQATLYQYM